MKKVIPLALIIFSILSVTSVFAIPPLSTTTFPIGTYVIPMDEKQTALTSVDVTVFGFIWAILDGGADIYRIIEPPDVTLYTTTNPGGAVYSGGVILVMEVHGAIITAEQANFPTVVVDTLTEPFTSDKCLFVDEPTNILVIHGVYGHTEETLDWMKIPYTMVEPIEVQVDPDMLLNFDLVVDDCPGFWGEVTPDVATRMEELASNGGEIIFTDLALFDLVEVFPGYVEISDCAGVGIYVADIHNPPIIGFDAEYPSQYSATFPSSVYIWEQYPDVQVVTNILKPNDVRVIMDSDYHLIAGPTYAILACYFPYGDGLVEAFSYHPQEQTEAYTTDPNSYLVSALLYGNKFVTAVPPPPEEHDVEAVAQYSAVTDVLPGDVVEVFVDVCNNFDFTEEFDVTLYYDSVAIGTQRITLGPIECTTLNFLWDTTGVPQGTYQISAHADSGAEITEIDEKNNWCDMELPISVTPPPPEEHDVEAVSQTAVETSVEPGTPVDIEVTVRNNGDFTETFDVTCYYDGVPIGTQTVTLAPDASTTVPFTWDTSGVPLNEYLITAWADSGEAITEVDEDNNWCNMLLPIFVIPELPLGTVMALISTIAALVLFRKRQSIKI